MKKIKTILIGTPEFAVRIFQKLKGKKLKGIRYPSVKIVGIVTAEDKPVGRKQELTPSPVKKWALEVKLPILQPERINSPEWIKKIKELNPNLIIVAAFGQIIPKEILKIVNPRLGRAKFGALNIHPSLLPQYRGASPIQTAILNGDKTSGVTIMLMDEKMDHGPILGNSKFEIRNSKPTYEKLSNKLADLGAELLIKTLPDWINGKIKSKPQNHSKATFTKIIKKEDGKIDWDKSAEEIERQTRALNPWPSTFTLFNGKQLKILNTDFTSSDDVNKENGEVFLTTDKELAVQTENGILILKQVQLEGKKPMPAKDFLNGHPKIIGVILK